MEDNSEKLELHDEFIVQQKDARGEWRPYSFVDTSPGPLVGALRSYAEENPGLEFRVAGRKATEWVDIKDFKTEVKRPSSLAQLEKARHYTAKDAQLYLKKIETEHLQVDPRMLAILKKRSTAGAFD